MAPRLDRSKWVSRSQAKLVYCLTDRELDGLQAEERPNPRARRGPPMRLYPKEELERAALARWGSLAALEAERERRRDRREQRSIAAYFAPAQAAAPAAAGAGAGAGGEAAPAAPAPEAGFPFAADVAGGGGAAAAEDGAVAQAMQEDAAPALSQQQVQQQVQQQQQQQAQQQQGQPGAAPPAAARGQLPWLQRLPPHIADRVCPVPRPAGATQGAAAAAATAQRQRPGRYVLYWMQTAIRGHENPALDAAAAAATHLGLPLVVASFLLASHPYVSARRCKFVLEGLRDAQEELRSQGVELLVYLEGWSDRQGQQAQQEQGGGVPAAPAAPTCPQAGAAADPYLPSFSFLPAAGFQQSAGWRSLARLAAGAAVVVTEDMPVPPHSTWLLALNHELPADVPLVAVDTACLLPMRLVRACHEKAYAFRSASEARRKQRFGTYAPPAAAPVGPSAVAPCALLAGLPRAPPDLLAAERLGWTPLELASVAQVALPQRLHAVLAGCPGLDHSVPGVACTLGGSAAGYARWEAFRRRGLALYAARRNDAMSREGVSRLSPYHHYGMVSPFKVAREAALERGPGGAKFLDEFCTWREIGFNLCLHRHHDVHTLAALPKWARATLQEHAADPRPAALPYARLDAGATGDAWWDAAQRQLRRHGELHNNSRMTWGKAFVGWAPSPQAALSAALHCNHRWALDGCDPASYAGVLWCFGLYDAPKAAAATPITGCLPTRSTAAAARRAPPAAYEQLPA